MGSVYADKCHRVSGTSITQGTAASWGVYQGTLCTMLPPPSVHDQVDRVPDDGELNSDVHFDEMAALIRSDSLSKSDDNVSVMDVQVHSNSAPLRPPIDYSSPSALFSSAWARFLSIWTRRFTLSLLAGQVVSLCITCTNVTTTELVQRNWSLPTTQTFFLCVVSPMQRVYSLTCWAATSHFLSPIRHTRSIAVSSSKCVSLHPLM